MESHRGIQLHLFDFILILFLFLFLTCCWDISDWLYFSLSFTKREIFKEPSTSLSESALAVVLKKDSGSSFHMHLRILPPSMERLNIPDVFGPLHSVCVSHAAIR